jgi:hypothetical protein
MKVFVINEFGNYKVGDCVDLVNFVAEDLIIKGFVSETNQIKEENKVNKIKKSK